MKTILITAALMLLVLTVYGCTQEVGDSGGNLIAILLGLKK